MSRLNSALLAQREFRSPSLEHIQTLQIQFDSRVLSVNPPELFGEITLLLWPELNVTKHFAKGDKTGVWCILEGNTSDSPVLFSTRNPYDEFGESDFRIDYRRQMSGGLNLLRNMGELWVE